MMLTGGWVNMIYYTSGSEWWSWPVWMVFHAFIAILYQTEEKHQNWIFKLNLPLRSPISCPFLLHSVSHLYHPPDSQKHNILLNWQNSVIIYYKASCSSSFFFNTGQNTYWDYWQSKKLHQNKMPWGIITPCWEEQSCLLIPGLMSSQANCFIERQKVSYVR